jgi:hypothetical protein
LLWLTLATPATPATAEPPRAMGKKYAGERMYPRRSYARPDVKDDHDADDPPANIRHHIANPPPKMKDGWGDHPPLEKHSSWYRGWVDHLADEDTRLDRSEDGHTVHQMKNEYKVAMKAYAGQIPARVGEKSQNRKRVDKAQAVKVKRKQDPDACAPRRRGGRRVRAKAVAEPESDFERCCAAITVLQPLTASLNLVAERVGPMNVRSPMVAMQDLFTLAQRSPRDYADLLSADLADDMDMRRVADMCLEVAPAPPCSPPVGPFSAPFVPTPLEVVDALADAVRDPAMDPAVASTLIDASITDLLSLAVNDLMDPELATACYLQDFADPNLACGELLVS